MTAQQNETIRKFGYPATLLREYAHWVVLLRPKQITAGSMVLACKGEVARMPDVSVEAYTELKLVTGDLERALAAHLAPDKINYILLMMVDPHVHFHVVPRYATPREVAGVSIADTAWPKPPVMSDAADLDEAQFAVLLGELRVAWPR